MEEITEVYVGELIRKAIKDIRITNGFVIMALSDMDVKITPASFSNKIYGVREQFTYDEVKAINKIKIFKQDFPLPAKETISQPQA